VIKHVLKRGVGALGVALGVGLATAGRRLLLGLHAHEKVPVPSPLSVGGRLFDVAADIAEYTNLRSVEVDALLRRRVDSFRVEWHTLRPRSEDWFYISSRGYLFANASHFHGTRELGLLCEAVPPPAAVLDFGGGTGNLTLALAAAGYRVDYLEISALQKDFVRFRVAKHGLGELVRVLDRWESLTSGAYDLVCAFDVLEHLHDLPDRLAELLDALGPGGTFVESSPFVRNLSNPMHHDDVHDLDVLLTRQGLELITTWAELRLWRRGTDYRGRTDQL
jgi:SAM-dependent methyltransferase